MSPGCSRSHIIRVSVISIIRGRDRVGFPPRNCWIERRNSPRFHGLVRGPIQLTGKTETSTTRIGGRCRWVHRRGGISGHTSRGNGVPVGGWTMVGLGPASFTQRTGNGGVDSRGNVGRQRILTKRLKSCSGVRRSKRRRILIRLRRKMCWCCCCGCGCRRSWQVRVRSRLRRDGSSHGIPRHGR